MIVQQQLNGENFFNLQKNLVKLEDALEVDGTLSFEYLALNYPLQVETINTHKLESLIDWTKEVVLNQNIKVVIIIIFKNLMTKFNRLKKKLSKKLLKVKIMLLGNI